MEFEYAPRRCNCWVWAHVQLWTRGGYVAKRRSAFSPLINHYLWSPDLREWWQFEPDSDKPRGWWFEAIWFAGSVKRAA